MNLKRITVTGALGLCTGLTMLAQADRFSEKDKTFLTTAAQADMAEMSLAQLALQKSSNDDVKAYAQQMLTDHQKLEDSAKPVVLKAGLTPPTEVNPMQKKDYDKLQKMSGTGFDTAYIRNAVQEHTKVLRDVKSEERTTQNSDMKTLSATAEPIVSDHQKKAHDLAVKMGVTTNRAPSDKS